LIRKITKERFRTKQPAQQQKRQPGRESLMLPVPEAEMRKYKAAGKLKGKTALITGGDSGIGRAVAIGFAKEGADVAIVYLEETEDAVAARRLVEAEGRNCLLLRGDVGRPDFCRKSVERTVKEFGRLDILVNNAAEQHLQYRLEDITDDQLHRTFRTNIFAYFYLSREALKYMKKGSAIINTTSITAYLGHKELIDYASTKGAIVAFTRSLSMAVAKRGIRVNGVAPGPIWTPLIPASFPPRKVKKFGTNTPMGRAGQPDEVAPCYVFLSCDDSSYMNGQVLHPNGGRIVNG
jgi:NAD(P)-dependent dehydrogenase (short-subunit alcohol dehydrogenase family)